jgi:hypothetical protein
MSYKMRDLGESTHWSKKRPELMSERDWRIFREDHDIIIKGGRVPRPMREWDESLLPPNLMDAIRIIGINLLYSKLILKHNFLPSNF